MSVIELTFILYRLLLYAN